MLVPYLRPRNVLNGYIVLGALTPDQAVEQIFPAAKVGKTAGGTAAVRANMVLSAQQGQISNSTYNVATGCQGYQSGMNDVQLAQTASGLALSGTSIGLTASGLVTSAALAPWTLGISAVIGLFPIIFGHHAAAVKKEQSTLCAAVPAANNYLNIIDQALRSGQITPQHAIDALNSLYSDFSSQVASIVKGTDSTGSQCNAACVIKENLKAVIILKTSQYQDLISQQQPAASSSSGPIAAAPIASGSTLQIPQPGTTAAVSVPAPATGPNWLGIAAIAAIAFVAAKVL